MKSAILTLILLIFIFFALNSGILSTINSSAFHYLSVLAFVVVIVCAAIFIGFSPKNDTKETPDYSEENQDDV